MPKKEEATAKLTFKEIWTAASKIPCGNYVKKKNGLDYLSWSDSWALTMSKFPQATFAFKENEVHPDGSLSVVCSAEIDGNVRSMWLPITNYSNKVIMNPSGRDINDSKMRCLVKTLSLFGIGFHIYQGKIQPEDTFNDEEVDEPAPAPKPKSPPRPVKPTPVKPVPPVTSEVVESSSDQLEDPAHWVNTTIEVAEKFSESADGLRSLWQANKKIIDSLDANHPEQYKRLKEAFTKMRDTLEASKAKEETKDE